MTINFTDANNYGVTFTDFADDFNPSQAGVDVDVNGNAGGGNVTLQIGQFGAFVGDREINLAACTFDSITFDTNGLSRSLRCLCLSSTIAQQNGAYRLAVSGTTTLNNQGSASALTLSHAANDFNTASRWPAVPP